MGPTCVVIAAYGTRICNTDVIGATESQPVRSFLVYILSTYYFVESAYDNNHLEEAMTVIAYTLARPHTGNSSVAENRARQLGEIYSRHGASVKVATIVSGQDAGCIMLLREYADFRTAAKAFKAVSEDPAHIDFWKEREANPAADIITERDILRTVYGENRWDTHPVSYLRRYDITRDKVAEALKLFPEVEKIVSEANVNVVGALPVTGENLSSLTISYQFSSVNHWGEALDTGGMSDAFQALVAKAVEFGTLRSAFTMIPI